MIDLTVDREQVRRNAALMRDRGVILPTLAQMRNPDLIPDSITARLAEVGLWDVDPLNLFRISWKNEPRETGGAFGRVNYLELPRELTGVKARIIGLVGRYFPTGAHKVGATYGCLIPKLVTGRFDPVNDKAVWPSTGNFCRGGAFNAALIGCQSIAILPEEMSRERFDWLKSLAGEVIATPGSESNVKEIYDKCWELKASRDDVVIFNQFEEFGNYLWHYQVTGPAIEEAAGGAMGPGQRLAAVVSATGSAGTIACGDYIKDRFPGSRIVAVEALQCPTLLMNGYGAHRIEGIGDKHVPWIHNIRNTDLVIAVDDDDPVGLIRLFNEPIGRDYLAERGVDRDIIDRLPLLGVSGAANVLAAIKSAKYWELTEDDVIFTILTDSMDLYQSRIEELRTEQGAYGRENAAVDYHRRLLGQHTGDLLEPTHPQRKRIHNLKYFTWVEQQGKQTAELNEQWFDWPGYWRRIQQSAEPLDRLIEEFNRLVGAN